MSSLFKAYALWRLLQTNDEGAVCNQSELFQDAGNIFHNTIWFSNMYAVMRNLDFCGFKTWKFHMRSERELLYNFWLSLKCTVCCLLAIQCGMESSMGPNGRGRHYCMPVSERGCSQCLKTRLLHRGFWDFDTQTNHISFNIARTWCTIHREPQPSWRS